MKGSFSSSSGHYRHRTPRLPPPPRPTAASGSQVSHTGAPQTHCSPIFPHGYCGKSSTYLRQPPPSFSIELHPSLPGVRHRRNSDLGDQIRALVDKCDHPPEEFRSYSSNGMIATLFYRQWNHARDAFILLWSTRLSGEHTLTPKLRSSLLLPSGKQELNDSVKTLFLDKIDALLEGEQMRNWQKKLAQVLDELGFLRRQMNRKNLLRVHKESNLGLERDMIMKRMEEFKAAMDCIRAHLEDKPEVSSESFVPVFKFVRGEFNWSRIHHLILRECKRLDDGLPIYAHRKEILQSIYLEQIMVLIGETGSGKSTQLTQFIADSGLASGSIVCTQPRKIAAISLSDRVNEESIGCYQDNSIICYPTSSPSQLFRNNVIYMTDHCLLQHYLQDNKLSGISCIIIDEAHERSLNTDLLLAQLKLLLAERECLRLIIMSATADAKLLSDFFYECKIMHVVGRNYPVEIRYTPFSQEGRSSNTVPLYVTEAVRVAKDVHRMNKEGTILTFLTSQAEVEWACDNFLAPSAIALPLHGKLTHEMQQRIFQFFPGKRKVIFATNLAETSLTIPGVRFVVDSGMMKENKFEPTTGMNILRVCTISKSSANQRAGRAGRTEPGVCYRLYSACDFESMSDTQEPEIRRVHLGIAVLSILAFGAKKLQEFEFIDAPSDSAIDTAIRNLIQLGAVTMNHGLCELTRVGRYLVKLGIEPRLGKLILGCLDHNLGREGVALAAMMANSSSIFCRVGSDVEKLKADSLKVQFCHQHGDLFTLLSVYKHWVEKPHLDIKNKWCWENSINAKAMRRCHETVKELEDCLRRELCMDIPSMWRWNPHKHSSTDKDLQKVILSCLVENVAMYTGLYRLGYEVAVTGQQIQLHPSCSLLVFGERPSWVVFREILSVSNTYLVCVTAFDFECLSMLCPPPPFDPLAIENRKLVQRLITGYGSTLLKRFCGKFNSNLNSLLSRIRTECSDNRVSVEVDVNQNEVSLFASSEHMERVFTLVNESLEYERKHLLNECIENPLYHGSGSTPVALLGAGAEIKHVELKKNTLSIDVYHPAAHPTEDKELMMALEKSVDGIICSVHKYLGSRPDGEDRFCRVTFTTPEAARRALELRKIILSGAELKFLPSQTSYGNNSKAPFHGVKARVRWPRKQSIGVALVAVNINDVFVVLSHFSNITIGGERVYCERVKFREHNIAVREIPRELSEGEVYDALSKATNRRILDLFLRRGRPVENPPAAACEDALIREISPLMPRLNSVQVSTPQDKDAYMKALITFDAELHLEAAAALESIQGRVLPGFLPWQKIEIQQQFQTSLFCSPQVYHAIKEELDSIFSRFKRRKGTAPPVCSTSF
ncbi:hypothetical protein SAY86_026431 [Trapa natans]|uniref:RNA helicase n=1 Tax=Trapa natans TaxID=22666 RepID=A0AAN7KEA9_TRANT|nr:hypothetical protein SAY86_026431 [Trapa natans]